MEYVIALLVGLAAALAAYQAWPLPAGYFAARTAAAYDTAEQTPRPFYRALLATLMPLAKYTPAAWMRAIGSQLYWSQLAGRWLDWTIPEIVSLHLSAAIIGVFVGVLLTPGDLTITLVLGAAGPFLLNVLALRAPARRVHRQIQAELPEIVSLLAAEVAANTTLSEGLNRLSRGAGVGATWIRRVVTGAVGDSLFSTQGQVGALQREARASGDNGLIALAINLDKIAMRGTGARDLLAQTARSTAAQYVAAAQLRAEQVGSEIILPMIFFFFLPYVAVILMVLSAPLLGGGLIR
jgi:hypothetical protein